MSVATHTAGEADDPDFDVMMEVWFENYHAGGVRHERDDNRDCTG